MYGQQQFTENLETFKMFVGLLHTGIPDKVATEIKNSFSSRDDSKIVDPPINKEPYICTDSPMIVLHLDNVFPPPLEHSLYIDSDYLIYQVPGDGSCLYGAAAAMIYQDDSQALNLRRLCHIYHMYLLLTLSIKGSLLRDQDQSSVSYKQSSFDSGLIVLRFCEIYFSKIIMNFFTLLFHISGFLLKLLFLSTITGY